MVFYTINSITGGNKIKYVPFNPSQLLSIASFTNVDICYIPVVTKISNFLHNIYYWLSEIFLEKIILSKNQNFNLYASFLVLAIVSIYNINKIKFTKLSESLKYT